MHYMLDTFSGACIKRGYLNKTVWVLLTLVVLAHLHRVLQLKTNANEQSENVSNVSTGVFMLYLTHTKQASLPTFLFAVYPYAVGTLQLF